METQYNSSKSNDQLCESHRTVRSGTRREEIALRERGLNTTIAEPMKEQ
jgi:hypothetical protein